MVLVNINGIKFRALLDSGASHSYVSQKFVDLVGASPATVATRQISTQYDLTLESVKSKFSLNVRATGINRRELLEHNNNMSYDNNKSMIIRTTKEHYPITSI